MDRVYEAILAEIDDVTGIALHLRDRLPADLPVHEAAQLLLDLRSVNAQLEQIADSFEATTLTEVTHADH